MGIREAFAGGRAPAVEAVQAEVRASSTCIPYSSMVDASTVRTKDGSYLRVIRLAGYAFDTSDVVEIDMRKQIRNHLWRMIGSSQVAVYHHLIRREVPIRLPAGAPPGFAQDLDRAWGEQLAARKLYTNEIYLTVIHKPGESVIGRAASVLASLSHRVSAKEHAAYEVDALARLGDTTRAVLEQFRAYRPVLLGMEPGSEEGGVPLSAVLRFLGFLMNFTDRPHGLPEREISDVLPLARTVFRHEVVELWHTAHTHHAGLLSVKEYSAVSAAPMLDRLLSLPMEFCMSQSFRFEERMVTESEIDRQQRRLIATGDKGVSQVIALNRAMDENKSESAFGLHHQTIAAWAPTPEELARKLAMVDAALAEVGIAAVRENANLEAAFYAQLPGNFRFVTRGARLSTKNFASLATCHNFAQGQPSSIWGPAVTVLPTASSTAHHFNFHVADRGNTLILGPTGQGKTLASSFLFAQSLKLGGRRVFFDKDRGMEIFIRALGGHYSRIESRRSTGWNPLQMPDSSATRSFLQDWFESLLTDPGSPPLDVEDRQRIKGVVTSIFDLPHDLRVLKHVAPLFGNAEQDVLARRLLDWYAHPVFGEGRYAWLFDNPENSLDTSHQVIGFDLTQVLDMPLARAPVVLWLFHVVESITDGSPLAIFADEGWRLLDDELVARKIEDIEFVIRKKNGFLAFATQAPETIMSSRIAPALKQQSETYILFPNPRADEAVYRGYLDLNATQFDLIKRRLPQLGQPGWFLVKNSLGASVCHLDMRGMDDHIAVLSGNKSTVALMDRLIATQGSNPEQWLPSFLAACREERAMSDRRRHA